MMRRHQNKKVRLINTSSLIALGKGQKSLLSYLSDKPNKDIKIDWGTLISKEDSKNIFSSARLNGQEYHINDVVSIENRDPSMPHHLVRIIYLWKDTTSKRGMFHAALFIRGNDTALGEAANANEVFVIQECQDVPLSAIIGKVKLVYKPAPSDWATLGGQELMEEDPTEKENIYYYKFEFNTTSGCFTSLRQDTAVNVQQPQCIHCETKSKESQLKSTVLGEPSNYSCIYLI